MTEDEDSMNTYQEHYDRDGHEPSVDDHNPMIPMTEGLEQEGLL